MFDVSRTRTISLDSHNLFRCHLPYPKPPICFFLKFELQRRGHRISLLNALNVRDRVLAANLKL